MGGTTGGGIPKIIHQIWLGKNPRPDLWMDTMRDFCSEYGYEYKLWTEDTVKRDLSFRDIPGLEELNASFGTELAGQADIIRLLALYKYGGLYIDADSVMMKPAKFAKFLEKNHAAVFFGWEDLPAKTIRKLGDRGSLVNSSKRHVANGVIGAAKKHGFIRKLLGGLAANAAAEAGEAAWRKVGPLYTTRMYFLHKKDFPDVHVYPMKYFYPMHWHGISDPELHKRVKIPEQSMLFQYGYSTNKFAKIFKKRQEAERRRTRRRRD